jgi:hypothetical protein
MAHSWMWVVAVAEEVVVLWPVLAWPAAKARWA